jgi:hypothetical protein
MDEFHKGFLLLICFLLVVMALGFWGAWVSEDDTDAPKVPPDKEDWRD